MFQFARCKMFSAIFLCVSLFAVFLAKFSAAQEGKPPALPLPEMQKLSKLYVGKWEYTETYPKSVINPNGAVNTGVYTSELGPGGNSIFNHFHSKGQAGEFDGTLVMNWDPVGRKYNAYLFSDSTPGPLVQTGNWEDDALVYRVELPAGGKKVVLRNTTKFLPDGKLTSDAFYSVNDSPEKLMVHVDATKK